MTHTPRRRVRVLPPLRGRLAATVSPEQKRHYAEPILHRNSPVSKSYPQTNYTEFLEPSSKTPCDRQEKPDRESENLILDDSLGHNSNPTLVAWLIVFLVLLAIFSLFSNS